MAQKLSPKASAAKKKRDLDFAKSFARKKKKAENGQTKTPSYRSHPISLSQLVNKLKVLPLSKFIVKGDTYTKCY